MLWFAHRGLSSEAPENTMKAFALAIEKGADGIELDVRLSKDNQLVVIHDAKVNRTTNGKGIVEEMTAAQLKTLEAGAWFSEHDRGEKIPLLEEVLTLAPKDFWLNIEMKAPPSVSEEMERRLSEELVKLDRLEKTIVSSFDHERLYRLKQLNPTVNIGLLFQHRVVNMEAYLQLFSPFSVHSLHPHYSLVRQQEVENWRANGIEVYPYTVNNRATVAMMEATGVSGIISDKVSKG